jgi:hypothetical protein
MTDHAQARAEGRAEGIREAADKAAIYRDSCTDGGMKAMADTIRSSILALIDAPSPTQPAQVSVAEAARIVWEDVMQKPSKDAARLRCKMVAATMQMKIPSIPSAQRWAIVNTALRALAQEPTQEGEG